MRLQKNEAVAIKSSFLKYFHRGSIYLFGSRVNDNEYWSIIINQVYEKSDELIDIYKKIKTFCKERIIGELS